MFRNNLTLSEQRGIITHFILLITVVVILIAVAILVFLGLNASNVLSLKPNQNTQYQNPFNKATQYENPFDTYQNPFDEVKQ